jgi:tetratricopeptide (TPR) repeat protein
VLAALARLYQKAERWDELADIHERQADILEDEVERLAALAHLGVVRSDRLGDVPGALEAYRRALAVDMTHEPSRLALAHLLDHEDDQARLEAAALLHPIYEAEGAHEKLLRVVEVEAKASDDPAFRAGRYETAVRIAEDSLGDDQRAMRFAVLGTKEAATAGDLTPWLAALERLAPRAGARAKQVEVMEAVVGDIFDVEKQVAVQKRVAELKRMELSDKEGAISAYQKVLEFQPGEHDALVALEELFFESEEWEDLLNVIDLRIEAALEDSIRRELSFRRAKLLWEKQENLEGAIETYEQILDMQLDPVAISSLEKLYEKTERYEDLISLIQRRIDEGDADRATLRVQLAGVCTDRLKEMERGLDELEQALNEDSQHQGAVALLEALLGKIEDPILLGRTASLLEPVYMVRADYDKVLSALSLRLDGSDVPVISARNADWHVSPDPDDRHQGLPGI